MVRRRERREIRATGRPMPYDDGLPEGQHGPEHHAQHRDGTDTPDGGGTPVRTFGGEMGAGEPGGSTTDAGEPLTAGAGHHKPPRLRPPHRAEPDIGAPLARVAGPPEPRTNGTPAGGPTDH
ncbi:hypothetical protein ABZT06_35715 [Streptomyces sp. NPDC005483]|uniref:hypothetical protein n=1 Tax=Streptomyces sp. NPDC005483 TaxID=3154882 RepID=UPI0033BE5C18